jgi:hypothetical protein
MPALTRIQLVPEVQLSLSPDAFRRWFIEPSMTHFKRIGGFSAAETEFFLGDLHERARQGRLTMRVGRTEAPG